MMRDQTWSRALACVGAVVGAGLASGREVVVFFSQYGPLSWSLILLAAGFMCGICALMMRKMRRGSAKHWCAIYQGKSKGFKWLGEGCVFLLMAVTGGAMLSAAGHLVALVLPWHGAFWIGLVGTLLLAIWVAQKNIRPLAMISGLLACGMVIAYLWILSQKGPSAVFIQAKPSLGPGTVVRAVLFALAYGGMNMAIALGVVCSCSEATSRTLCRSSLLFGLTLTGLLFLSNVALLQNPQTYDAAFPIMQLLGEMGLGGYYLGAAVLYLAVFTTLIAILRTLQSMASSHSFGKPASLGFTLGVPLLFSLIGFQEIVENWYAPIGLCCLLLIFIPSLAHWPGKKMGEGTKEKKGNLST